MPIIEPFIQNHSDSQQTASRLMHGLSKTTSTVNDLVRGLGSLIAVVDGLIFRRAVLTGSFSFSAVDKNVPHSLGRVPIGYILCGQTEMAHIRCVNLVLPNPPLEPDPVTTLHLQTTVFPIIVFNIVVF